MEEIKQKLDLILNSQLILQNEVIRLGSRVSSLDEKFENKFNELDQKFEKRFDTLEATLEQDRKEIGSIFNDVFKRLSA